MPSDVIRILGTQGVPQGIGKRVNSIMYEERGMVDLQRKITTRVYLLNNEGYLRKATETYHYFHVP